MGEKSVFDASKWLPYYNYKASVALLCPENSLSFTYPLLKKSSRLSPSKTKKILPALSIYMAALSFMKYFISFFETRIDMGSMAHLEILLRVRRGDVPLKTWTVRLLQRQLRVNATISTMRLLLKKRIVREW